ncbi:MAG TPA: DivIVA domain-containing protein [Acidimicrobiia bacterium]|nr:DivIVA domain-containing protein [Acidimicrobiia bacterium]
MAITPADIEKKTFSTALRGYDLDEVDDFLDEMVVAVRELEEDLARARERIAQLEQEHSGASTPSPTQVETPPATAPGIDESAVGRALVAAQQTADRMLEEAREEAERIVSEARSEADTFARDRDQRRAAMEAEMADMTGLVAGVRTQLAVLATTVADKLDEMDAAVAEVRGKVAGQVDAETGDDQPSEPESPDLESPDLDSPDLDGPDLDSPDLDSPDVPSSGDANPGESDQTDLSEEDRYDEQDEDDDQDGLEIDIEDVDSPDEEEGAGSSELEGFRLESEDDEI